jgi:hypothetical protein
MDTPYTKIYRDKSVTGGGQTVLELGFPARCRLTRMVVKQTGGALTAFTVDLFSARKGAVLSASSGGADPDGDYAADPENYRVCRTVPSDEPGLLVKEWLSDTPLYENQDGGPTSKKHRIYLEIETPGSATGELTFDITLTAEVRRS